jgi:transposase
VCRAGDYRLMLLWFLDVSCGRADAEFVLTDDEREQPPRWSRRAKTSQALAVRSKIVLACARGLSNVEMAGLVRVTPGTVTRWRGRFVVKRLEGLVDEPRPGRPASILLDQVEDVLITTLERTPPDATHWSRSSMAARSGLSPSTIGRIWRRFDLKPHVQDLFKLSTDPQFVDKVSTWSGSTTIRRRRRWCCAWMRSPGCRPLAEYI